MVYGLDLIPYSFSISLFSNLLPTNSCLKSYGIFVVQVYLDNYVVSVKFSVRISLLSLYFFISNHPVTILIIIIYFKINSGLAFLRIL